MARALRFSELSPARQVLVRLSQALNFGQIQGLHVRDTNPVFDPQPVVLVEERLDVLDGPRRELELPDFELSEEVRRLMERLDEINNGTIERIEVRAGVPRRISFQSRMPHALR